MDEPNLFGVKPKKRTKRVAAPNGAMQRVIGTYKAGYERRFSEPPVLTKRDANMLKTLVLRFGTETVCERLRAYLEWDDRFAEESGFAVSVFYTCWPRLTALVKRRPSRSEPDAAATRQYIAQLRAAKPDAAAARRHLSEFKKKVDGAA